MIDPGLVAGVVSGLAAIWCARYTYIVGKDRNKVDERLGAIEGFDKLTEDQRIELDATKVELRDTRSALREAEVLVHAQGFKIDDQARQIALQEQEIHRLEARVKLLEEALPQ